MKRFLITPMLRAAQDNLLAVVSENRSRRLRTARLGCVAGLLLGAFLFVFVGPAGADLDDYIKRPEDALAWKLIEKRTRPEGVVYDLQLISQSWQGILWKHQLQVYQPATISPNATMFLWVTGGSANPVSASLGLEMARRMKVPVAFLHNIPNQPLLEGRFREDDLIAETFVRYLNTKDENWPFLFPMVKSVVKAMDALQAFTRSEWNEAVKSFIVSGASKRGWTTWLTAAVDARVKAIAPLAIDTLNMRAQLPRQLEAFGAYSEMIAPYTKRRLVPIPETPEGIRLWSMVDPWAYRQRLTLPKLIVNGTNDPYWTTDALNVYWNDLEGDKSVLYVPNARHNLRQQDNSVPEQFSYVLNGLAAFVRHQITDKAMPKVRWRHDESNGKLRLTIEAAPPPLGARLWTAQGETKDFRQVTWMEQPAIVDQNRVVGEVMFPAEGYTAFFGELDYEIEGLKYHLSTQIRIAKKADTKTD